MSALACTSYLFTEPEEADRIGSSPKAACSINTAGPEGTENLLTGTPLQTWSITMEQNVMAKLNVYRLITMLTIIGVSLQNLCQ